MSVGFAIKRSPFDATANYYKNFVLSLVFLSPRNLSFSMWETTLCEWEGNRMSVIAMQWLCITDFSGL